MRSRAARAAATAASLASLACGPTLAVPEPSRSDANELRTGLADAAAERARDTIRRLLGVSTLLRVGGAPLCGDGLSWVLGADFDRAWPGAEKVAFLRAIGLDDTLRFLVVMQDSAAERAGIEAGDVPIAANGHAVDRRWKLAQQLRRTTVPLELTIERQGARRTVRPEAPLGCSFEIDVKVDPQLEMGPVDRGSGWYVSSGFVEFTTSDDELAIVVSHAMAHSILGHDTDRAQLDHETEADRLGLYLAARAGFDVSGAPALWERVAIEKPWEIAHETGDGAVEVPHGRIGRRLPALRRVVEEIREARAAGRDLRP